MISRRRILALFAASPALRTSLAAPQAQFSSGVKVVNLLVTVRDESGKFVNDLAPEDFVVEEDGQPQTLRYFSRQNDLPLTLGLLVDTSESQNRVLGAELAASVTFFRQVLREGVDQAFLSRFDSHDFLLQNVTGSRAKLEAALGSVEARVRANPSVQGTLLYDDIAESSDLIMKQLEGRKALVVLTDGEDMGSKHSLDAAIASCQHADTVVYSIGIGEGVARGAATLEILSRRTGGEYFEVGRKQTVEGIYRIIEEELRSQYNLGFAPAPDTNPNKNRTGFHKVRVTITRRGITPHTRDGYYSGD